MRTNIEEVMARGGQCYTISTILNNKENDLYSFNLINDESIFESTMFFQMFAYFLAILKGYNPDRPRNLAKSVTVEQLHLEKNIKRVYIIFVNLWDL